MRKKLFLITLVLVGLLIMNPAHAQTTEKPFIFGLLLVGPYNDHGWSQAHYEAVFTSRKSARRQNDLYRQGQPCRPARGHHSPAGG